jgi:hypothetical protein
MKRWAVSEPDSQYYAVCPPFKALSFDKRLIEKGKQSH